MIYLYATGEQAAAIGLAAFGAVGILVGPLVAAVFLTVREIYGIAFRDVLPARSPAPGSERD